MPNRRPTRTILLNLVVAVAYFVTGWLGLQLPYYGEHVTLVWVPTAIALAAIILVGPTVIPGIFLGGFGLNVTLEPDLPGPAALIAIGNTLEVLKDYPVPKGCTSPFAPIWIAYILEHRK